MQDLAYGLWACADREVHADQIAYRIMSSPFDDISKLSSSAISKLTYGLAKAQIDDPQVYAAIAQRATEIAKEFFPRDIAKLFYGLGNVNYVDMQLLRALEPCMMQHLFKFNRNVRSSLPNGVQIHWKPAFLYRFNIC